MKNFNITKPISRVARYKIQTALLLTLVPVLSALLLLIQLLIFSMLNVYYLEGNGLIISEVMRSAYYDRVISEMLPGILLLLGLTASCFAINYIVMNWVAAPFVTAEKLIRSFTGNVAELKQSSTWLSENSDMQLAVHEFLKDLSSKNSKPSEQKKPVFHLSIGFLIKFITVYVLCSTITAGILASILFAAYNKTVAIALSLMHNMNDRSGHFFTAQEQVLSLGLYVTFVASIFVYAIIGYKIARYMATMVMVFHRSFRERRYPIQLRKTDVYLSLAEAINEKVALLKKS